MAMTGSEFVNSFCLIDFMTFVILRYTNYGWSDYLGSATNLWNSKEEAEDAIVDLQETAGFFGIWKIVPITKLNTYQLVA